MTALDKAGLVALADRVEALAGPCRETDALIWEIVAPDEWAVFVTQNRAMMPKGRPEVEKLATLAARAKSSAPRFTATLDAAMTLVPTRWKLRQMNFSAPCADDRKWHLNLHGGSEGQDWFVGRGSTKELALTAAALRAIAAGQP